MQLLETPNRFALATVGSRERQGGLTVHAHRVRPNPSVQFALPGHPGVTLTCWRGSAEGVSPGGCADPARTGRGPTAHGTRRSCGARRSGTSAPGTTPARADCYSHQAPARAWKGSACSGAGCSGPQLNEDDCKFALAFRVARLSATSNVPRLPGQHDERKRHQHGRALGMALTFCMQSGTGWSLRARRSLPTMRLPAGVRDSPLFTACAPVPPPAEVPTRPAANSSYG